MDYWGYTCVFTQCAWTVVILAVAKLLSKFSSGRVGRESLFLYLSHISVIGYLSNRFSLGVWGNVFLSIVTVAGLFLLLQIGMYLSEKLRIIKLFKYLTGMRVGNSK